MQPKNSYPKSGGFNGYWTDSALEAKNDCLTDELRSKIDRIKHLSIDIGTEIKGQNRILGDVDLDFDNAGGFLEKVMNRTKSLAKGRHNNNYITLYLFLFSLLVFLLLCNISVFLVLTLDG